MEGFPDYTLGVRGNFCNGIASGQLQFIASYVNRRNINDLIAQGGLRGEIDFLSIDIDSNDYHVFEAFDVVSPRVVCLEHNQNYTPGIEWVMPYNEEYRWDPHGGTVDYGTSISSMAALAERKGYRLVGCGPYSASGFYVRTDLVTDHFTGPFTPERLFNPMDYSTIIRFPVTVIAPPPSATRGGLWQRLRRLWT